MIIYEAGIEANPYEYLGSASLKTWDTLNSDILNTDWQFLQFKTLSRIDDLRMQRGMYKISLWPNH